MDPPITSIAIANAYTPTRLSTYSSTPACTAVPALMGTVPNVSRLPRSPNTMPPMVAAIVPMAAIGPIAATIGGIVFGERGSLLTFGTVPMSAGTAVQAGVLEYVLNLVGVYALAMAIDVIGGSIGAQRNRVQALKVAAYASTPYWLASVFALFPRIEPLGMLVGLYSVRLFAVGLPPCMKVPRDKT